MHEVALFLKHFRKLHLMIIQKLGVRDHYESDTNSECIED